MNKETRVATTADRLREVMRVRGMKQTALVAATGLPRSTVSRYMSGGYEPKAAAINKLAVALDVSEMWLWGYDVPKERPQTEKKNDQLSRLIVRMRRDPVFYSIVENLDQVPPEQLGNIAGLLAGLLK